MADRRHASRNLQLDAEGRSSSTKEIPAPLSIENPATTALVDELARRRGVTKQEAVRQAVQAELDRLPERRSLVDRVAKSHAETPLPPRSGLDADKAFYDDLSGET